jgi:hypothetical protein
MSKWLVIALIAFFTLPAQAVPLNDKLEGYWVYKDVKQVLKVRGFEWDEMPECLSTSSTVAVHCTSDFWNDDGVRISVAVRKTLRGDSAGRAYRIVCTAGCRKFSWGQLASGRGRRDPLE